MRGLAFFARRLALVSVAADSVMPDVMLAIDDAQLPATRLPCAPPNRMRSALSVVQVFFWAAVAASRRAPLTRWPLLEPRPAGAVDASGIVKNVSTISSR